MGREEKQHIEDFHADAQIYTENQLPNISHLMPSFLLTNMHSPFTFKNKVWSDQPPPLSVTPHPHNTVTLTERRLGRQTHTQLESGSGGGGGC